MCSISSFFSLCILLCKPLFDNVSVRFNVYLLSNYPATTIHTLVCAIYIKLHMLFTYCAEISVFVGGRTWIKAHLMHVHVIVYRHSYDICHAGSHYISSCFFFLHFISESLSFAWVYHGSYMVHI